MQMGRGTGSFLVTKCDGVRGHQRGEKVKRGVGRGVVISS